VPFGDTRDFREILKESRLTIQFNWPQRTIANGCLAERLVALSSNTGKGQKKSQPKIKMSSTKKKAMAKTKVKLKDLGSKKNPTGGFGLKIDGRNKLNPQPLPP
jgi:hypothetical protein